MERKSNVQPKLKIKKGDTVKVIAGESKGQQGKVLEVMVASRKLLIERVNMISKHTKPNAKTTQGDLVEQEADIHISNVMLVDPSNGKTTRVGRKSVDGKLVRVAKKSGEVIK